MAIFGICAHIITQKQLKVNNLLQIYITPHKLSNPSTKVVSVSAQGNALLGQTPAHTPITCFAVSAVDNLLANALNCPPTTLFFLPTSQAQ